MARSAAPACQGAVRDDAAPVRRQPVPVAATRLGGYHGYDDAGATNPLGGPVVGFTKSYKKERPDATVKAVDLAESRKTTAVAEQLIEETLCDPGCVEIGRADGGRFGVAFIESPFPERVGDEPAGDLAWRSARTR